MNFTFSWFNSLNFELDNMEFIEHSFSITNLHRTLSVDKRITIKPSIH